MNCNHCRYELSQCLDGRLPSGRRTIVMQHAAECAECGTFWSELQAAQKLTLQLSRSRVSADFRESLWQRIQAGEGTPDAVFREPVPLLAKLRYAMTGAAAAAAALLCVSWLGPKDDAVKTHIATAIDTNAAPPTAIVGAPDARVAWHQDAPPIDESPLFSSAQRLRLNLVAVETARQLDQRFASTTSALRRLERAPNSDEAIEQVLVNVDEFHTFGELLLELHDGNRLLFADSAVEPDLRFATTMFGRTRRAERSFAALREIVEPVLLRGSLASVARTIAPIPLDPSEEMNVLLHLNTQRPEIFPKLFFVIGNNDQIFHELGLFRSGAAFFMADDCGPSWVAPRSEVEARDGWMRLQRSRASSGKNKNTQVQIQVIEPPK